MADPVSLGKGVTHNLDVKCGELWRTPFGGSWLFEKRLTLYDESMGAIGFGTPVVRAVTSRYSVIS